MVAANVNFNIAALRATGANEKESVDDVISNITPTATPILSMLSSETKRSVQPQWEIDTNDPPTAANAHYDGGLFGDIITGDTTVAPRRVGNYNQIFRKHVQITRRAEKIDKYGRRSERDYQIAKKMPALKTDIEASICANVAATPEVVGTNPGRLAGFPVWLTTNDTFGTGGASGALSNTTYGFPTTARTDGTLRALSEAELLTAVRNAWVAGGEEDKKVWVSPAIKDRINAWLFSGSSTRSGTQYQDQGAKQRRGMVALGSFDIWVTSFGSIEIGPSRNMRSRDVLVLDMSQFGIIKFEPIFVKDVAELAPGTRRTVLEADLTLKSTNEAASAGVFDINDVAMVA